MNLQEELALLVRAQSGDREALGELWDELTPKLFGYLVNVTGDRTLAEDILQTTWLNAINALSRFRPRGSGHNAGMGAWLFAIARNECRQHWRKAKHEPGLLESDYDTADNEGDSVRHNKLMVEQALNRLSEDDRELLRLRYIADLPVKEMARVLNLNSVAVRVRLHRAITRARVILTQSNL